MNISNHHEHTHLIHSKSALKIAISATVSIFLVELVGGFWTHSIALLSDATHTFMDSLSFALSLIAILLAERPVTDTRTFGWHRLEVLAAMMNGITILLTSGLLLFYSIRRLFYPVSILGPETIAIALLGLIVNLIVIWKLHPHHQEDVNIKSAYLHAVGDATASVTVVIGILGVYFTGNQRLDPITAILISGIISFSAFKILKDSFHILMEGVPRSMDRNKIWSSIEEISGKGSVHDLHIWNICSHLSALSLHLKVSENRMIQQKDLINTINHALSQNFNIEHTTIQIESDRW